MNPLHNPTFSDTEQTIVIEKLSDPSVQKYFNLLMAQTSWDITMAVPADNQDVNEFLRKRAAAQGQIMVLLTLINIAATFNKPASADPANQTE